MEGQLPHHAGAEKQSPFKAVGLPAMPTIDPDQPEPRLQGSANSDARHTEVRIAEMSDAETLNTCSLVLSAADISHRICLHADNRMEVFVEEGERTKALLELDAYARENVGISEPEEKHVSFVPVFRAMSPLLTGGLILLHGATGNWRAESLWFIKGAGDSSAILHDFQYYRLITSLTLHADIVHLLSNCFLGLFLLHFFFHLTGNGIGLFTLLLTAACANLLNVLVHGPGHLFVGFSTAIFSIIGMLCTMNYIGRTSRFRLHFLMPLMSGLALLAILGSSGERTDLGAHLFGLLCGLVSGNMLRLPFFSRIRASLLAQGVLLAAATFILVGSWLLALS